MKADETKTILRGLPDAFWDVDVWSKDGEDHKGNFNVDVADRRRIVETILGLVAKDEPTKVDNDSGEWGYVCRVDDMGYS